MHAEVTLDAIAPAAVGTTHGELVAGLGIEAEARKDLRAETAGELQPRRLLEQGHRVGSEHRGGGGVEVAPDIGEHVRLPHPPGGIVDGPLAAQAQPSGGAEVVPSPTLPAITACWVSPLPWV